MFVIKNIAETRYSICKSCSYFNNIVKTCTDCNCFMPFKVKIAAVSCPHNKWAKEIRGEYNTIEKYSDMG